MRAEPVFEGVDGNCMHSKFMGSPEHPDSNFLRGLPVSRLRLLDVCTHATVGDEELGQRSMMTRDLFPHCLDRMNGGPRDAGGPAAEGASETGRVKH